MRPATQLHAMITALAGQEHTIVSTTDAVSQTVVAAVLVALFALLTLEKAHRVLVALGAVCLLWTITYLTPWKLISFESAVDHLDLNVLLLLAGMMALVGVLRSTGVFEWAVLRLMHSAGAQPHRVLTMVIWFTGLASALVDNVTTVIFVTPIVLGTARTLGVSPVAFLLPMIMAANIGGTATLVGDPPNIMIGSGANLTFMQFIFNVTAPALFMLALLEWVSRRVFRSSLRLATVPDGLDLSNNGVPGDPVLLRGLAIICAVVLIGFVTHGFTGMPAAVPAVIGSGAALILQDIRYLGSHGTTMEERKHGILAILEHEIEWPTLAFFTFLFIIVGAAVDTGLIARVAMALRDGITTLRSDFGLSEAGTLMVASILIIWSAGFLSALIDNIPFVAVCIPVIHEILPTIGGNNEVLWWALALGACLGGNGTPVGASANVTAIGLAERSGHPIAFRRFLRFGVPIMLLTLLISTGWVAGLIYAGRFASNTTVLIATLIWVMGIRLARRGAEVPFVKAP